MNRACSLFEIKSIQDDERVIEGTASTPSVDRVGDIVEPMGAKFSLPMPLLWHHQHDQPIGHVEFAKAGKDGIRIRARIAKIDEPGNLKERTDEAWQSFKAKPPLVGGLSIGFKIKNYEILKEGGWRIKEWDWLELSAVTIAANADCTIDRIKSLDAAVLAATGHKHNGDRTLSAGVTASRKPVVVTAKEAKTMKTLSEQITALEAKRAANTALMEEAMQKGIEGDRTSEGAEQEQFDTLEAEVETIDKDLKRLRSLERIKAQTAKPVPKAIETFDDASAVRGGTRVEIKMQPKLEPGIGYARLVKVKMAARLTGESPLVMAQRMYGPDSEVAGIITKANEVVAGTTIAGNWAADLVSAEGAAVAAFLEYLRPATILGKFGTGGIPNLTRLDFYSPYVIETGAGDAYWVGQGLPKPVVAFDYDRSTLTPLKIANICVLTEENVRYSSPNSDMIVRNALVKAIAAGLDLAFITPSNSGTANVKPASVTNGAETVASTGDDADDIRLDVRALFQKYIDANNPPLSGVWVMSATNALALSMMTNPLGQPEFTGVNMNGGTFQGLPVIASQHISNVVALINASDIFLGDEGGVSVDMSREASIEMRSTGLGMDATAGTATAASVSMFQTNSVALRAERTISWKRARVSAVAYLTSVDWGGAVPTA